MENNIEKLKEIIMDHVFDGKLDEFGTLVLSLFSISFTFAICKDKELLRLFLEAMGYDKKFRI